MITGAQIREARRLLKLPVFRLAQRSKVASVTIARAEQADGEPKLSEATLIRIRDVLETAGIDFLAGEGASSGVRMRAE